jgi:hypothetical protein
MCCVKCEGVIMKDRGDQDEMIRLLRTGELQMRTLTCSFYDDEYYAKKSKDSNEMVKIKQKHSQTRTVCGFCVRKEKAEEVNG